MNLLIISNMSHYEKNGEIVGWGPTVQEIDSLAKCFDEIIHVGCLLTTVAPNSALPYSAKNVKFIGVPARGGDRLIEKLGIIGSTPEYINKINYWLRRADVVHVRCPANIPLIALLLLIFTKYPKYRWVKYAGNWQPRGKESLSYTIQRWILRHNLHHGVVTINGEWPGQPTHVYSFMNPCLSKAELEAAQELKSVKTLKPPYQLLFVGRLETAKGVGTILEIAGLLHQMQVDFDLHLVGDGPEHESFEKKAQELGISGFTHFHGWLPRTALNSFYQNAHFFLLPSSASEGWPKVLSEAMAYGAVVLASNISSIPLILGQTQAGFVIDARYTADYASTILRLIQNPDEWRVLNQNGIRSASLFSYETYLKHLQEMFKKTWGLSLQ